MFFEELTKLATQTSLIVILLLVIGVVFCFVEAIVPNFGFFGITGILSVIAGVVVHAILSGSVLQVLIIIFILALVFALIVLLFLRSAKYGLLAKLSFVENKTALPLDYAQSDENNLSTLIGKNAKTVTECRPVGKIEVDGTVYDALAKTDFLASNVEVLITEVDGNTIYIEKSFK
jgi:membrane-bound ClpP family serine protease